MTQEEALTQIEQNVFPKWKSSAVCLLVWSGQFSARICLNLGYSMLLDKPLIVLVTVPNAPVPVNLKRCASEIVYGDLGSPQTSQRLNDAICSVMVNDLRVRR